MCKSKKSCLSKVYKLNVALHLLNCENEMMIDTKKCDKGLSNCSWKLKGKQRYWNDQNFEKIKQYSITALPTNTVLQ